MKDEQGGFERSFSKNPVSSCLSCSSLSSVNLTFSCVHLWKHLGLSVFPVSNRQSLIVFLCQS
jgi:hypothetical protein